MRICMVVPYDLSREGGVKKHALCLARALEERGDDVTVIGPAAEPVDLPRTKTFGGVVSIRSNGSDNRLGLRTAPWQVRRYLRDRPFDIVHVHEPLTPALPFYALWWARARARVATFHCFAERESFGRLVARRLASHVLDRVNRAIAVSDPAARYASACWRRPLAIIPNGVDTRFFAPPAEAARGADSPVRLLFVGQWSDERKGLSVLLQAYAALRGQGIDVSLNVVGHGNRPPGGDGLPPGVTFHGCVPEDRLRRLFHDSDIFVSPAIGSESFGMVLVEAMAAGRPVVCSDIEGYRQVATGRGSVLVPPRDADALASALRALASEPGLRRKMGEINLTEARRYDWRDIARRVRGEYRAALAQRGVYPLPVARVQPNRTEEPGRTGAA